jgi:arylsulfatase A-like enzyme
MKPNIVFILLDNVGWGDIGCYGDAGSQRRHQRARIAEGFRPLAGALQTV